VSIVLKSGILNLLEHSRPLQACNRIALPYPNIWRPFLHPQHEDAPWSYDRHPLITQCCNTCKWHCEIMEYIAPTGIRHPNRLSRSQSLYRLSYPTNKTVNVDMIYIFNRTWVDTRWQQYSTHLHTNYTHNTENGKFGSAGRALSLRVIPWHLRYNWGKSTEKPQLW
jgi:hypothetical protein